MLQFDQHEIESAASDILIHTDRTEIARITGIYRGVVTSMFDPNDERKSAVYVALQIICALDEIDPERGQALFQKITEFRELSKKRRPAELKSVATETGKLNKEVADFVCAKLEGKPHTVQITELLEAQAQLETVKQNLFDEYNALKETPRETSLRVAGRGNN